MDHQEMGGAIVGGVRISAAAMLAVRRPAYTDPHAVLILTEE
ncbi:hypothetical protein ABZW47_16155 [Streptomyces sp. NPDC004549]